MKRIFLIFVFAIVATIAVKAQKISVVSPNGATQVYKTFQEAIEGADPGSVIYLPGGGFPISDAVKITKKLTIIGIGHKIKTENPDGYTTIGGNLIFNQGSDGSAVLGCHITGTIHIGEDGNEVDDVLIRCNNTNGVYVRNSLCKGTTINQNYIRGEARFSSASARFTNNISPWVYDLDDGYISNNIITGDFDDGWNRNAINSCDRTSITNNIILSSNIHSGGDCQASGNMCLKDWGDDCINVNKEGFKWEDVFEDYKGITPTSKFTFKEDYKEYQGKVGIYSGTDFSDDQLAPVPYIVAKSIPEQTDASGKLNIKIRVKAGK